MKAAQNRIAIAKEVEQAEFGARNEAIKHRMDIAETELTKCGAFEQSGMRQVGGGISGFLGRPDAREVTIRRQAHAHTHAELGETSGIRDNAASLNGGLFEATMRDLVRRIEEEHKQGVYRGQFGGQAEQRAQYEGARGSYGRRESSRRRRYRQTWHRIRQGTGRPAPAVPLTAPPPRPPQRM